MRKTKGYVRSLERKQRVSGKVIAGIDPAKEKHQVLVLEHRMQKGESFTFNYDSEAVSVGSHLMSNASL